jgi:ribosomal protein L11 methyltransferase
MNKNYIELQVQANEELQEILVAVLSENNFEGFVQNENELLAYCPAELLNENEIIETLAAFSIKKEDCIFTEQQNKNWNEEWEKNFESVLIADKIYVRALFHPERNDVKHTITIQPKMSFGTGHHSTTKLVLTEMLQLDLQNKTVLDMGSGTAVLAIYAEMAGASNILAIDNDEWAFENAKENCLGNDCKKIEIKLGDEKLLNDNSKFDVIVSNITKNFNLANLPLYAKLLNPNGEILLSGFYESDGIDFFKLADELGLKLKNQSTEKNWTLLHFA